MNGMERHRRTRGGFSLIEMIIAVTVLALLGTTVVRVFLAADGMNHKAAELDKAVSLCTDSIERLKAEKPSDPIDEAMLARVFPDARIARQSTGWQVLMLLDGTWSRFTPVHAEWPAYRLVLSLTPDEETSGTATVVDVSLHAFPARTDAAEPSQAALDRAGEAQSGDAAIYALQAMLPAPCAGEGVSQ